MAANARRVREIRDEFPEVAVSVLVEHEDQIPQWQGADIGVFLDINPGMNRTGIEQTSRQRVLDLARAAKHAGLEFRGLHYYDGQFGAVDEPERTKAAHAGYDRLMEIVSELGQAGVPVPEIVTAGTPAFPPSLAYSAFQSGNFIHRISPGTIVYNDATSLAQLPEQFGYMPAAQVVTRVVSQPRPGIVTCDAGHKAVSADAGVPTCVAVGHPELTPLSPSEEHLPMSVREGSQVPRIGEILYLLPRHVCPTVNNFDAALIVKDGKIESVEVVSARGHEGPLLADTVATTAVARK
jgi:D-serine deaminase-like pyridoxal phosphate-dependent protein